MKRAIPAATLLLAFGLTGCGETAPPPAHIRPVRAVTVEQRAEGETVSLTGHVRAREQASLSFRINGRMVVRPVYPGDTVTAGQVVGRLDAADQENSLRSAQAQLASAEALLTQTRQAFWRQSELLRQGWTPRARYDDAQQAFQSAEAQVASAGAQLRLAQDQLAYTVLRADAAGTVTAVGAEAGEVVRAGGMVVQLAREAGRDAVFDVPEALVRTAPRDPAVEIVLSDDPAIRATGRVREVSPQADATTRTYQVKVTILDPPEAMRLGSTVSGRIRLAAPLGLQVPATALTVAGGRPAVWVLDLRSETVSLRTVEVARHDPAAAVVAAGLEPGEVVVTAGAQVLRPGQRVRRLGDAT
ncbi:efflux RND transporter periplasmic adaptor subunit [Roseomonas sp. CCTCC AB2023176]|uniref:efflux RND transporter periplasmic adaptor subunit n=1 Tax=Roseomonas sp. CCTCC AB2023176 TaxID=3342640 RepID=UPI0035DEC09E